MFIDKFYNVSLLKDGRVLYTNSFYDCEFAEDDFVSLIIDASCDMDDIDFDHYIKKGRYNYSKTNQINGVTSNYEILYKEVELI